MSTKAQLKINYSNTFVFINYNLIGGYYLKTKYNLI